MHPEEQLSAYLDGELADEERTAVEAHLESCAACRSLLHELAEVQQTLTTAMFALPEPPDFEHRVMQAVIRENKSRPVGKAWMLVPMLATMTLILLAYICGPVFLHIARGVWTVSGVLLYAASHAIAHIPILAGSAAVLSLIILLFSAFSLRRLLRSSTVGGELS